VDGLELAVGEELTPKSESVAVLDGPMPENILVPAIPDEPAVNELCVVSPDTDPLENSEILPDVAMLEGPLSETFGVGLEDPKVLNIPISELIAAVEVVQDDSALDELLFELFGGVLGKLVALEVEEELVDGMVEGALLEKAAFDEFVADIDSEARLDDVAAFEDSTVLDEGARLEELMVENESEAGFEEVAGVESSATLEPRSLEEGVVLEVPRSDEDTGLALENSDVLENPTLEDKVGLGDSGAIDDGGELDGREFDGGALDPIPGEETGTELKELVKLDGSISEADGVEEEPSALDSVTLEDPKVLESLVSEDVYEVEEATADDIVSDLERRPQSKLRGGGCG
jgi:hypothetical protein